MKLKKSLILLITTVIIAAGVWAGAGAAGDNIVYVDDIVASGHYPTLSEAYAHVNDGGVISMGKDVTLDYQLEINKGLTLEGNMHKITSHMQKPSKPSKTHLILVGLSSEYTKHDIKIQNLTFDFFGIPGDLNIVDHISPESTRYSVSLENLRFINMSKDIGFAPLTSPRSALHINGANVIATNLTFEEPGDLFGFFVATIDLERGVDIPSPSNLTIDVLPYGAHCFGEPQATVWQNSSGTLTEKYPSVIELLFGEKLYVWPGFAKEHFVTDWAGLSATAAGVTYGDTIVLQADIISDGTPLNISFTSGAIINTNKTAYHNINLTNEDHGLIVFDLLGLANLINYDEVVVYGKGYIKTGDTLSIELAAGKDVLSIPKDTVIHIEATDRKHADSLNVTLPPGTTAAVIPADEYGLVHIDENRIVTINGEGSLNITDDPLGNATFLPVNGTLNLHVTVNEWPSLGINGNGIVNIYKEQTQALPGINGTVALNFAPFTETEHGRIMHDGKPVDSNSVLYRNGTSWTVSGNLLTVNGTDTYVLEADPGYTGSWTMASAGAVTNARIFKAAFTQGAGEIVVSTNTIGFGTVDLNTTPAWDSMKKYLNVTNHLSSPVELSVDGEQSAAFIITPAPDTLQPSASQNYTITVNSTYRNTIGDYAANLTIKNASIPSATQTVTLSLSLINTTKINHNTTVVPDLPQMDVRKNLTDGTQNVTVAESEVGIIVGGEGEMNTAIIRNDSNASVWMVITNVTNSTDGSRQEIKTSPDSEVTNVYKTVQADLITQGNEKVNYQVIVSYGNTTPSHAEVTPTGDFNTSYAVKVIEQIPTAKVLSMVSSVNANPEVLDSDIKGVTIIFQIPKFNVSNPANLKAYHVNETVTELVPDVDSTGDVYHNVTVTSTAGFSSYIVCDVVLSPTPVPSITPSHQTGYTQILPENTTATPTATQTVQPIETPTTKPTSSTSKSPAPFVGILAGLGGASVLLRLRK